MDGEQADIGPDDTFLRRIPVGPGHYDSAKNPPIGVGSFRPSASDTDGLSLYRERATPAEVLAAGGRPGTSYVIVRFTAREIRGLGLTIRPDQQPGDLPGHHLIPEINTMTYDDKMTRGPVKEACKRLADLANQAIIFRHHAPG